MALTPKPASPYRRRRILWSIFVLVVLSVLYLTTSENQPSFLKNLSFRASGTIPSFSSSRVSKVADAVSAERRLRVQEIHGLLHFVTAHNERRLNEDGGESIDAVGVGLVKVDPSETVDLRVYAPDGDDDWSKHLKLLKKKYPLIVFSKSYCPYSRRAKALLESYNLSPAPFVIELDSRSDGPVIQAILRRLTGRGTVPNVILQAKAIGGSDDIQLLDQTGELKEILKNGGLSVQA